MTYSKSFQVICMNREEDLLIKVCPEVLARMLGVCCFTSVMRVLSQNFHL